MRLTQGQHIFFFSTWRKTYMIKFLKSLYEFSVILEIIKIFVTQSKGTIRLIDWTSTRVESRVLLWGFNRDWFGRGDWDMGEGLLMGSNTRHDHDALCLNTLCQRREPRIMVELGTASDPRADQSSNSNGHPIRNGKWFNIGRGPVRSKFIPLKLAS